jgi:hypothetical protein
MYALHPPPEVSGLKARAIILAMQNTKFYYNHRALGVNDEEIKCGRSINKFGLKAENICMHFIPRPKGRGNYIRNTKR